MGLICKLFNFFLNILGQVVDFTAGAVKTVGGAVIGVAGDLLSDVLDAGSSLLSKPLFWVVAAGGAYFLLTKKSDSPKQSVSTPSQGINLGDASGQP